ncbi:CDP-glycerol glycerophosphotransferase family protein [Rossellomorea vietnamensis]|uniref:CDP-glycerol glycerophosphotransferase family protein n=1 Tax=Rossellomorea vietnamensis TaxID=218284 RepID=UPI001E34202A|nr:CDP-glycerol glycerophosphotransferase family protein [Rossellomorea vietnamensis]MCC5803165.1 CDP-glycerol glycerophosphotransferase family protein [Rossellomorea vietnamensis]
MSQIKSIPSNITGKINSILYRDHMQVITLYLENSQISDEEVKSVQLLFKERVTGKVYSFPIKISEIFGEIALCEAQVDLNMYGPLLFEGKTWDLYIERLHHDGVIKKQRVKSNQEPLELMYFHDQEEDRMLVPFSTNKYNFSFIVHSTKVIAKIENFTVNPKGIVSFEGFASYPDYDFSDKDHFEFRLLLVGESGEKVEFPLTTLYRPDLSDRFRRGVHSLDYSGFRGEFDIHQINMTNPLERYRVKVGIKQRDRGEKTVISNSIKILPHLEGGMLPKSFVVKSAGEKIRLTLSVLKKKRTFFIRSEKYDFISALKKDLRRKYILFRNSDMTKKLYYKLFGIIGKFPVKKNLIMFESFLGKQYSDNPRAIYEYMKEHYPEYDLRWAIDKKFEYNFEGKGLKYIKRFSLKWLFTMPRAKYWVTNSRFPLWIPKPEHTTYLQTWHGTPLKRLAADMQEVHMPGTTTEKYKRNFISEAGKWDYLISPNGYSTEIFRRAFRFDKEMIESGYPRNDVLYNQDNEDTNQMLRGTFGIPADKKVILYAPTWRDDQFYAKGKYRFDLELDLQRMKEEFGDEYVVLLRMHYLVAENLDISHYEGFVYDFSNHEDIRDLYLIADLLITDYSSVFFDYANLRRPMIFFAYDIDQYKDKLRGFYFDFENEAPGPLVKTTGEVIQAIKEFERTDFALDDSFESFYRKFCYLESGQSTKRVVDRVFKGSIGSR